MSDKHLSAEELIAQDSGARMPDGIMAQVIAGLALLWSLFQLWIASPLPFIFRIGVFNDRDSLDPPYFRFAIGLFSLPCI